MSDEQKKIFKLQNLLLIWLSHYNDRSLEIIKSNCDSLCESYKLSMNNPTWSIFWPLVFNGLVDHVGNGHYTITEPLIIDCKNHFYFLNFRPKIKYTETSIVGIFYSKNKPGDKEITCISAYSLSILKQIPSIKDVVDAYPMTLQDESGLEYYNYKTKRGIAKLEKDGLTRYFSIPETLYIRQLPDRNIDPEAFAITYCLSRSINNESNGVYIKDKKTLYMPRFAMPFTIYRLLLLESMKSGILPTYTNDHYIFCEIEFKIVKELNRIFCNSISYE